MLDCYNKWLAILIVMDIAILWWSVKKTIEIWSRLWYKISRIIKNDIYLVPSQVSPFPCHDSNDFNE